MYKSSHEKYVPYSEMNVKAILIFFLYTPFITPCSVAYFADLHRIVQELQYISNGA